MTLHVNQDKKLSIKSLLAHVRNVFSNVSGKRNKRNSSSTTDGLMSALAMFGLKMPSLKGMDAVSPKNGKQR
jgi:hypothetical protein